MIALEPLAGPALGAWRDRIRGRLVDLRVAAGLPRTRSEVDVDRLLRQGLNQPSPDDDSWLHAVVLDGSQVGTSWVFRRSGQLPFLLDLDVPAALLTTTLRAVASSLAESGVTTIEVPVLTGQDDLAGSVAACGGSLTATHMARDLSLPAPTAPRVTLLPFTDDDFTAYQAWSIDNYADEIFKAGGYPSPDDAHADSVRQFAELLPDGLASAGQHLWAAHDGARRVGLLWIFVDGEWSYIYDIEMLAECRGQGYGTEVLDLGADEARQRGATHLGLNVFGHNADARRLYARSGFGVTREFFLLPTS